MADHAVSCVAEELSSGLPRTLRTNNWSGRSLKPRLPDFMSHSIATHSKMGQYKTKATDCSVLTADCRMQTTE